MSNFKTATVEFDADKIADLVIAHATIGNRLAAEDLLTQDDIDTLVEASIVLELLTYHLDPDNDAGATDSGIGAYLRTILGYTR